MALSDIFTGGSADQAYAQQRAALAQAGAQTANIYGGAQTGGIGALQAGQAGALGALGPAYTTAQNYVSGATPSALSFLTGQGGQAINYLTQGQSAAIPTLQGGVTAAQGAYTPLSDLASSYASRGGAASDLYADALGLNGPEGIARAKSSFTTSPGYQFSLGQGIDAITRAANTSGMGASGNTLRAAGEYATNAANKEYQDYLKNVFGIGQTYAPLGLQGTQGAASGVANAALTGGTSGANIYTGTAGRIGDILANAGTTGGGYLYGQGNTLADLVSRLGTQQAGVYTGTGSNLANLYSSLAPSEASQLNNLWGQYGGTYPATAAAQLGASANAWNLIGNLALGGMKLAGGAGGTPTSVGPTAGSVFP